MSAFLIVLLSGVAVNLVFFCMEQEPPANLDTIRMPKKLFWFGLSFVALPVVFTVLMFSEPAYTYNEIVIVISLYLIPIGILYGYFAFQIEIDAKSFVFRDWRWRRERYMFKDVWLVKYSEITRYYTLTDGKKKLRIPDIAVGVERFIGRVRTNKPH